MSYRARRRLMWLVVAGGLVYTVGGSLLVGRGPDPWPGVFGYHEVWHSFTVLAAVLHFVAVGSITGALTA